MMPTPDEVYRTLQDLGISFIVLIVFVSLVAFKHRKKDKRNGRR